MKRLFSFLFAVILLSLSALPCYAAEDTMTEPGNKEKGVYIDVDYTPASGTVSASEDDGEYRIETPDGTEITVKPQTVVDGLTLVVYPIPQTDAEAYKWFEEATTELGNKRYYYDIYFVDTAGNRVDGGKCEVTVTLPEGYGTPNIAILNKDGKLTTVTNSVDGGKVKFTMSENGYYVLAEKVQTDTPVSPSTGDDFHIWWWLILMIISGAAVVGIIFCTRKRKVN